MLYSPSLFPVLQILRDTLHGVTTPQVTFVCSSTSEGVGSTDPLLFFVSGRKPKLPVHYTRPLFETQYSHFKPQTNIVLSRIGLTMYMFYFRFEVSEP